METTRYAKKIKIIRNNDVKVFEKDVNDFIDSHKVTTIIYKPIYRTEYRDIVYTCFIEYIEVVKEA